MVGLNDPSGIDRDRALVLAVADGTAELAIGPSRTRVHLDDAELPEDATVGTWVVMDLQSTPPVPLFVDAELTANGPREV